ncbi:MAG: aromatic ring-hydroxylating dioxygenase subunit alpha [Sphingomonadales bacterium]|nr:aromatic ring-hydroxylating dioxygenase subunit alpha [Sphingomonadales bacterium]
MAEYLTVPPIEGSFPRHESAEFPRARGDAITGDRYWSRDFARLEWEKMWTRVWHVGARESQLEEPGDYVVHNFLHESVIMIRQKDGGVRAFYNVCRHRGNRLVMGEEGGVAEHLTCPYHGWKWAIDGALDWVQDPEDFPQGNPCGKLRMKEVPCETWGGFVFYAFDPNATPLLEYLAPIPDLLRNRDLASWKRVVWLTVRVNTNWKFASDNFNESYHLPAVHPQFEPMIDDHYSTTHFEMYPTGHNRMIEKLQPSSRYLDKNQMKPLWAEVLREWDIDPADYEGRAQEGRIALQQARRKLGPARGWKHFEKLSDEELTDQFHHTCFPNFTITGTPEGLHVFRTEPDPEDPNWSTFDYWYLSPEIEGQAEVPTLYGMRPWVEAEHETALFGLAEAKIAQGDFLSQDLAVAVSQQQGLRSRGHDDAYLSEQETRIRRFHEVINDYIEGRR